MAALRAAKGAELEAVEARVRAALKKRDDMIASLRGQLEEARVRADTAQRLLEQQREDLLGVLPVPAPTPAAAAAAVAGSGASMSGGGHSSAVHDVGGEGEEEEEDAGLAYQVPSERAGRAGSGGTGVGAAGGRSASGGKPQQQAPASSAGRRGARK
jgi:hypothetical protein